MVFQNFAGKSTFLIVLKWWEITAIMYSLREKCGMSGKCQSSITHVLGKFDFHLKEVFYY